MPTLEDRVVLVTGASSGIGRAAALLFAERGARVVATARRSGELDRLVEEIEYAGGSAAGFAGDVADSEFAQRLVAFATDRFGGVDLAFNNAGTLGAMGPITDIDPDGWEETLRVNLTSAFHLARHQVPAMRLRGGGAIVFTSTFVGHTVGLPGMSAYAASKAGLLGLTRVLAAECAPDRIRVNALLPGGTDTPMGRAVASTPDALAHVRGLHALGRIAAPEEIAHSALYLLSDAASFTTGAVLLVDGGVSIAR